MATEDEKLATFKAIAGTDDDGFATSFLEAHDWNVETAVNSFIGGGGGGGGSGGGGGGGISDADMAAAMAAEAPDPQERAPLPQFVEQLMDPAAHHLPTVSHEQQSSSVSAALEAFQNSKAEGQSGSGDGDNGDGFGQRKRPRNLAEIYRQPTELCFKGSFDQVRVRVRVRVREPSPLALALALTLALALIRTRTRTRTSCVRRGSRVASGCWSTSSRRRSSRRSRLGVGVGIGVGVG